MKVTYKVSDKLTFELDCSDQKDTFSQLSTLQEIFGENKCRSCQSEDIKFVVRTVDENSFYELKCNSCGSKLSFGSKKKGNDLFPKRKSNEGKWLENLGWVKYIKPSV